MSKVVLLDFDGVVLRAVNPSKIVSVKANKYVQRYMKTSASDAVAINKYLYKTFGHTAIGLQKLGYEASIADYNEFVYKDINYKKLFSSLKKESKEDIKEIKELLNQCNNHSITVDIFSNSPSIWFENALYYMGINEHMGKVKMHGYIKPNKHLLDIVEREYQNKEKIIFVDDSFVNFTNTLMNKKWDNIMFTDNEIRIPTHINLKVVNNYKSLINNITSLKT